ncbi:MAG: hypothetical protein FWH47_08020, partial [Methanomassiliicoccaceae archaeon]|nr:hypothetical protein [Methanomassiliicoccaceae archaeon]
GGRTFLGWDKPFDNVTSDLTVYALYDGLAGSPPSRTGEWALLNLLMALAGVLAAVLSVAHAAREEGKRAGGRSEAPLPIGRSASWALLAGIAAVAGVVFFLVTEDMRLPMTLVDEWTVFSALVLAVTAMAAALSLLHRGAWRKVFRQGPLVAGGDRAEAGSPYPFTMRGGYAGAVSYRIGAGGEWRLAFPDGDGAYAIPGDEVTDDLYIEYHP